MFWNILVMKSLFQVTLDYQRPYFNKTTIVFNITYQKLIETYTRLCYCVKCSHSITICHISGKVFKTVPPDTLTHWGRVTHICVGNLTTIGSDNGLSPGRHQAIIWNNAELLLIGPWGTNFSEILIEIPTFSFKKMRLKVSTAKWRPFCLGLIVLS